MDVVNLRSANWEVLRRRGSPRPVREHGHRDDSGRQLGWRCDDGGDRPPGAQHSRAVRFTSTDFNSYVTVSNAERVPVRDNGFMAAGTTPEDWESHQGRT